MKYDSVIGVGGVGRGICFQPEENHTLGRNESRLANLTDALDYCKLHIVFHYIAKLLAPKVQIVPLVKLGADSAGDYYSQMLKNTGMDTSRIVRSSDAPTLFSVCIQYPDKSGCNITAGNSACAQVDIPYIESAINELSISRSSVVVALPEVPLLSRKALLKMGKELGAFCVASVTREEAYDFIRSESAHDCSLIALNLEEAAAAAGMEDIDILYTAKKCAEKIHMLIPECMLWITCGAMGSVSLSGHTLITYPPLPGANVISSAGAGDASLAGIITGLCIGLRFQKRHQDASWLQTPLQCACELGVLVAGLSLETKHSIHEGIDWQYIINRMTGCGWPGADIFLHYIKGCAKG